VVDMVGETHEERRKYAIEFFKRRDYRETSINETSIN